MSTKYITHTTQFTINKYFFFLHKNIFLNIYCEFFSLNSSLNLWRDRSLFTDRLTENKIIKNKNCRKYKMISKCIREIETIFPLSIIFIVFFKGSFTLRDNSQS